MAQFDDLRSHQEMWENFTKLTMWACIGVVTTLILMALFLL